MRRFNRNFKCPICDGYDEAPRGKGVRCHGFISDDGAYAHCTRSEHQDKAISYNDKSEAWVHALKGDERLREAPKKSSVEKKMDWARIHERIETEYDYFDEEGDLLFQVVRLKNPKQFLQRRAIKNPETDDVEFSWAMSEGEYRAGWGGNWTRVEKPCKGSISLPECRRVLYNLPQLINPEISKKSAVFVVEGEKDVETLQRQGLIATCNPGGAPKWSKDSKYGMDYAETLRERSVIIIEDYDAIDEQKGHRPGEFHANRVADCLYGIAKSVRIVKLPGLEEGEDVTDWFEKGNGMEDFEPVVQAASLWEPPREPLLDQPKTESKKAADGKAFAPTDLGNAQRLVFHFGEIIRFCDGMGGWMLWNKKVWIRDRTSAISRLAHKVIAKIYEEARVAVGKVSDKLMLWAEKSQADSRIRAMINQAKTLQEVIILPEQFDCDPYILNCANGIVDLRTGELGPHDSKKYQTNITSVDYDPEAESDLWIGFLRETLPEDETRDFVQRAAGYSTFGLTSEERLFFVHGQTNTGKSTFVEAIQAVMGNHIKTADFESFLQKDYGNHGIRNDLAGFKGKRIIISQEVQEGRKMAENVIKGLVAGDIISTRFLYGEHFEFKPICAVWLIANHKPWVSDDDDAMWRRLLQIPFICQVKREDIDINLKKNLREQEEHQKAVLAWLIFGAKWWYKLKSLMIPPEVRLATADYHREMDPLADWMQECVDLSPSYRTPNTELWASYVKWAETYRIRRLVARRAFSKRIEALDGVKSTRTGKSRFWIGLRIIDPKTAEQIDQEEFFHPENTEIEDADKGQDKDDSYPDDD